MLPVSRVFGDCEPLVARGDVRARADQDFRDFDLAVGRGDHQGRHFLAVERFELRAALDQQRGRRRLIGEGGEMERVRLPDALGLDVGAGIEQRLDDVEIAARHRRVERRAERVALFNVGAGRDQGVDLGEIVGSNGVTELGCGSGRAGPQCGDQSEQLGKRLPRPALCIAFPLPSERSGERYVYAIMQR